MKVVRDEEPGGLRIELPGHPLDWREGGALHGEQPESFTRPAATLNRCSRAYSIFRMGVVVASRRQDVLTGTSNLTRLDAT